MLSIQAVRGLPRLRALAIVSCVTIRDAILTVLAKADTSQLNLPHGTDN